MPQVRGFQQGQKHGIVTPKPIRFENHSQKKGKKQSKGKAHGVQSNRLGIVTREH